MIYTHVYTQTSFKRPLKIEGVNLGENFVGPEFTEEMWDEIVPIQEQSGAKSLICASRKTKVPEYTGLYTPNFVPITGFHAT